MHLHLAIVKQIGEILIVICIFGTTARGSSPVQCTLNDSGGTSAAISHVKQNRSLRTVHFTSTAFHAKITADDTNFFILQLKDFMRTHFDTHAAVIALFLDQLECDHLGIIS
jgi:hypothetical protein